MNTEWQSLYFGEYGDDLVMTAYNETYIKYADGPRTYFGSIEGWAYQSEHNKGDYIIVNQSHKYRRA